MMNLEHVISHLQIRMGRTMVNSLKKGIEVAIQQQKACFDEVYAVSCLADSLSCVSDFPLSTISSQDV